MDVEGEGVVGNESSAGDEGGAGDESQLDEPSFDEGDDVEVNESTIIADTSTDDLIRLKTIGKKL